jgi:hypothetical protein
MARGDWQLWIPGWNLIYILGERAKFNREMREREEASAKMMAEAEEFRIAIDRRKEEIRLIEETDPAKAKQLRDELDQEIKSQIRKLMPGIQL